MTVDELKNKLVNIEEMQVEIFKDVYLTKKYNYLVVHSEDLTQEEKELKISCGECILKRNKIWLDLESSADTILYNSKKENIKKEIESLELILNKIKMLKEKMDWK